MRTLFLSDVTSRILQAASTPASAEKAAGGKAEANPTQKPLIQRIAPGAYGAHAITVHILPEFSGKSFKLVAKGYQPQADNQCKPDTSTEKTLSFKDECLPNMGDESGTITDPKPNMVCDLAISCLRYPFISVAAVDDSNNIVPNVNITIAWRN